MKKQWWLLVLVALLLAACGGGDLSVEEILQESAATMSNTESVSFIIERIGEPVLLDPTLGASMVGAEGVYRAPDSAYAVVKVEAGSIVAEAEVLWIPDGVYFKLPPLLPDYTPLNIGDTFSISSIFSSDSGIPAVFTNLTAPELVGEEDIDGIATYHITATEDSENISSIVGGAVVSGEVTVDIYIDKKTGEVVRLSVLEADGNSWVIDFFDYGQPVEIPAL